jgi:hypothetical protein
MPFVWVNEPQLPSPAPVEIPGETATSTLVNEVANTVNAGGTLEYYTPTPKYNVVYVVPQLNVNTTTLTNATIGRLTINLSANVTRSTINTAAFGNVAANTLYITIGTMGQNPTSNLEIATKEYLDTQVANVPASGSDLQNIIDAAGDLLVGIAANTATRLPIGSSGQILTVDYSEPSGLRWKSVGSTDGSESFSGLWMQTHRDRYLQNTHIWLRQCDDVLYNDGSHGRGLSNLTCNIAASGAGGLDTGAEKNSQWYEIYTIHDSTNDLDTLLLHQCTNIRQEAALTTTSDLSRTLRRFTATNGYLGQSFISANTGPIHSVECEISSAGSPTGLIWIEVRSDSSGFPDSLLGVSRPLDALRIPTDKARVRFLFSDPVTLTAQTTYHIVLAGDYALSDANYIQQWGITAGGYASGVATEYHVNTTSWHNSADVGGPADFWFKVFIENIAQTNIVLPGAYDKYCLLGYVYNNSVGNFKHFIQKDRHILTFISEDWRAWVTATGTVEAVDMSACVPPRDGFALIQVKYNNNLAAHIPIGGVDCTDMPITLTPKSGYTTANTHGTGGAAGGAGMWKYAPIVLENQTMLIRSNSAGCNVYITEFSF